MVMTTARLGYQGFAHNGPQFTAPDAATRRSVCYPYRQEASPPSVKDNEEQAVYEIIEHTADVGLRIKARALDDLFNQAGRGLFSLIVENLDDVQPVERVNIQVQAAAREDLLFDWLSELLYLFDSQHMLLCEFDVQLSDDRLTATAAGEPLDPDRHQLGAEVKAITYHGFKLEQVEDGYMAELIVDI